MADNPPLNEHLIVKALLPSPHNYSNLEPPPILAKTTLIIS